MSLTEELKWIHNNTIMIKVLMQGKLFQRCIHLLYCSVLSLGSKVNTRRMWKPDMGSIFHIKNQWNILVIGSYYVNYQNYQNLMLLTPSETKRTLMHLFLFTNSAQRELVSICTQVYATAINFPCIKTLDSINTKPSNCEVYTVLFHFTSWFWSYG